MSGISSGHSRHDISTRITYSNYRYIPKTAQTTQILKLLCSTQWLQQIYIWSHSYNSRFKDCGACLSWLRFWFLASPKITNQAGVVFKTWTCIKDERAERVVVIDQYGGPKKVENILKLRVLGDCDGDDFACVSCYPSSSSSSCSLLFC